MKLLTFGRHWKSAQKFSSHFKEVLLWFAKEFARKDLKEISKYKSNQFTNEPTWETYVGFPKELEKKAKQAFCAEASSSQQAHTMPISDTSSRIYRPNLQHGSFNQLLTTGQNSMATATTAERTGTRSEKAPVESKKRQTKNHFLAAKNPHKLKNWSATPNYSACLVDTRITQHKTADKWLICSCTSVFVFLRILGSYIVVVGLPLFAFYWNFLIPCAHLFSGK